MTSLVAQTIKHLTTMQETWVRSQGLGRSPGEGNSNPLQYCCLENPMDGGTWRNHIKDHSFLGDKLPSSSPKESE